MLFPVCGPIKRTRIAHDITEQIAAVARVQIRKDRVERGARRVPHAAIRGGEQRRQPHQKRNELVGAGQRRRETKLKGVRGSRPMGRMDSAAMGGGGGVSHGWMRQNAISVYSFSSNRTLQTIPNRIWSCACMCMHVHACACMEEKQMIITLIVLLIGG